MLRNQDIIFISSIEWTYQRQGHQEIALRLSQAGNRVLYVENTGVRSPSLMDLDRVALRLKSWFTAFRSRGVYQIEENLFVCAPLVMPPFGPKWRSSVNRRVFLPAVCRAIASLQMRDPIVWTYLPTDTSASLINLLRTPRSVTVYYCLADFSHLTPSQRQLRLSEQQVIESSDLVFAQCQELATHCAQWGKEVHVFPSGVNMDAFQMNEKSISAPRVHVDQNAIMSRNPSEDFTQRLPRPVIGYVGGLHRHVDYELLTAVAHARPSWSWVCVGAQLHSDSQKFAALPNVYLVGQRPHHELAGYINNFDVCIVPYVQSSYTKTVVPTKINEYLAVGKPVISTPLPMVCAFNDRHHILHTTPPEATSFLTAIEQALHNPGDTETIARRRKVAALGDWKDQLNKMSLLIEAELARKQGRGPLGPQGEK